MKQTATALSVALALAVSGAPAAHAVNFDFLGESAALAIFGGDSEHIVQLGDITALTSGPATTFNIDPGVIAAVSTNLGAGGLKYALLGFQFNAAHPTAGFLKTVSGTASGDFSATQVQQWTPGLVSGTAFNWVNELAGVGTATSATVGKNDTGSFTKSFDIDGSFNGAFSLPQQLSAGVLGTIIMSDPSFNGADGLLGDMGQAILSADGLTFTIGSSVAPVPLPAAGILFATGLLGLVGISRRPKAN